MLNKFRCTILTLLLLAFYESAAGVSPQPANDLALSALSEGRIVVLDLNVPNQTGKTFIAGTIIDAPMATLCAIILDFAAYPRFMPNTEQAQIVRIDGKQTLLDMTLKLPLGKTKRYRLSMASTVDNTACRASWTMVRRGDLAASDTIADTVGSWKLTPLAGNAQKTVVQYFVYSDPGAVPLGLGWIVDALGKDSLPKTLEALRSRATEKL
jgi:ribosome-associated toxin RatA of RatAB toxin-antitoxin module